MSTAKHKPDLQMMSFDWAVLAVKSCCQVMEAIAQLEPEIQVAVERCLGCAIDPETPADTRDSLITTIAEALMPPFSRDW